MRPGAERVGVVCGLRQRRLHKAFLRWHDPDNWPLLREALRRIDRTDLIGNGKRHLVPRLRLGMPSWRLCRTGHMLPQRRPVGRQRQRGFAYRLAKAAFTL